MTEPDRTVRSVSVPAASTRGRLGAGIVAIPPVPRGDPAAAILLNPQVPEASRFCGNPWCHQPVGRTRNGAPGSTAGRCDRCGTRYSFEPKLSRGQLVGGQYEVQGCLAHGGLGWIYLAVDRNLHDRWVVLKGLLNSGDADAMAAAEAEVHALTEVQHPNIVQIHNFVQHPDPEGVPVGYIVMEYVGGTSLKQIRQVRKAPLSPEQAVAYIVEIAPALSYLHAQGLAFCDLKPDNIMQTDEQLKLIDLGAVVAMDDEECAIYGTLGYQAPEISRTGPTVASDVYTVGRTLAMLVMDVPRVDGRPADRLPDRASVPVLAEHESLYRAILRATDPDPEQRFSSIEQLTDQMTGVLHEIVAADTGTPQPRVSKYFSPQRAAFGAAGGPGVDPAQVIAALSVPVVDPNDPGAAALATTSGTPSGQLENALLLARNAAPRGNRFSVEVELRLVRAAIENGNPADARKRIADLEPVMAGDWRLVWYGALCALLEHDFDNAAADFDRVLAMLPGELAPKLAMAATTELRGDVDEAVRYYETVWRTDHSKISAAFGLARLRARAGDRSAAVAALDEVDAQSAHFTAAGTAAIEALLEHRSAEDIDEQTLLDAGARTDALTFDSSAKRASVRLLVLTAALNWLAAGNTNTSPQLLGAAFDEATIRTGMERAYRDLARATTDMWDRITLVEKANAIRPRTRT